jgi:hypothetical protein
MTAEEREVFYDTEVAPILMDLARKCKANGLSFVATVEWNPGDTGETMTISSNAGIKILMAAWAVRAHGNADALILAMMRHGKEHDHNSMCLHMLDRGS